MAAFHLWEPVEPEKEAMLRLRNWAIRGMGAPCLVWMLFNSGVFPGLPSFMPDLDMARGMSWFNLFCATSGMGILIIATYWGAITSLWLLETIRSRVENRHGFYLTAAMWTVLLSPILIIALYLLSGWFLGIVGLVIIGWLYPILYNCSPMVEVPAKIKPQYGRAIAHMQFGRYEAAEAVVIEKLEGHETDFDGWMMLAELYALQFNDLATADKTIHDICDTPGTSISQISIALHKLADWYLEPGKKPAAARQVLGEISSRFPGTHLDKMARQRMNQIPANQAEFLRQKEVKPISLPPLEDHLEEGPNPNTLPGNQESAELEANRLVQKLNANPNDMTARVSLARLLAERLDSVDQAIEQIESLLSLPGLDPRMAADWLNLIAGWQIRILHDSPALERTLERITVLAPNTSQALTAQRRLNLMRRAEPPLPPRILPVPET